MPPLAEVVDANPGTFYSAISNIDFEIGEGNPKQIHVQPFAFLPDYQVNGAAWPFTRVKTLTSEETRPLSGSSGR